jgi:hypothetical protein
MTRLISERVFPLTGSLDVLYEWRAVEVRAMEVLFAVSITVALLWVAFGDKKDWAGM